MPVMDGFVCSELAKRQARLVDRSSNRVIAICIYLDDLTLTRQVFFHKSFRTKATRLANTVPVLYQEGL